VTANQLTTIGLDSNEIGQVQKAFNNFNKSPLEVKDGTENTIQQVTTSKTFKTVLDNETTPIEKIAGLLGEFGSVKVSAAYWDPWEAGIHNVHWWGVTAWANRNLVSAIAYVSWVGGAKVYTFLFRQYINACYAFWWIVDKCIGAIGIITAVVLGTAWWQFQSKAYCGNGVRFNASFAGPVTGVWCK
jgi:hypothetical protein